MRILLTYPNCFLGIFLKASLKDPFDLFAEEVDYVDASASLETLHKVRPDVVILHLPWTGGIKLNMNKPAELMSKNLTAQINVIEGAFKNNVQKIFFISSSCMYPKIYNKKLHPKALLTGPLEETNLAYATAKISGWQLCKAFNRQFKTRYQTVISASLYGEYDDFSQEDGHVIGALLARFHKAKIAGDKEVVVWGTGRPLRDFMYAADFADALGFLIQSDIAFDEMNVGWGSGSSIKEIAFIIAKEVDYKGKIIFDKTKPDGMRMKVLDTESLNTLGWFPKISLGQGIRRTYQWYKNQRSD